MTCGASWKNAAECASASEAVIAPARVIPPNTPRPMGCSLAGDAEVSDSSQELNRYRARRYIWKGNGHNTPEMPGFSASRLDTDYKVESYRSRSRSSEREEEETMLRIAVALTLAAALLGVPPRAHAQAVTGTLLGNITDSSGAAVPGATVTATEVQTNTSRTVVSNETGNYTFTSLRNGTYTVTAEVQGFRKVIRQNVQVEVNTTMRVDLTLELGQVSEAVTV